MSPHRKTEPREDRHTQRVLDNLMGWRTLGSKSKGLRQERSLSKSALAMTVGVSVEDLTAIEEDRRRVNRAERHSFAKALGVTVQELLKRRKQRG